MRRTQPRGPPVLPPRAAGHGALSQLAPNSPCAIATWNINGVRARLDGAVAWLKRRQAGRRSASRRSRSRTSRFPRRGLRGPRLQHRDPRPEGLQRRRDPLEAAASTRSRAGFPATTSDAQARFLEAVFSVAGRRDPGRLALSAERQSDRHRQVRLQARLDGAARSHARDAPGRRGDVRARRRLQRHSRARGCAATRRSGSTTRCSSRRAARLSAPPQSRPDRRLPRLPRRAGHYTFWDYQAGAWQKNNGIRIDHLLLSPPAADRLAGRSTSGRAAGTSRPTTCRS